MDVHADELIPTTYSSSPLQGYNLNEVVAGSVGISFDSSKIAAINMHMPSDKIIQSICVWDLPSGALLYTLECDRCDRNDFLRNKPEIQWSWTDQYLLFKPSGGDPRYLNAETFREEVLEHPADRFQGPYHLYYDEKTLRIRLSSGREGPLFSALPSLANQHFSSRGDRVCTISENGRLLLLDTSGLEAYMEICDLQFQPEVSYIKMC